MMRLYLAPTLQVLGYLLPSAHGRPLIFTLRIRRRGTVTRTCQVRSAMFSVSMRCPLQVGACRDVVAAMRRPGLTTGTRLLLQARCVRDRGATRSVMLRRRLCLLKMIRALHMRRALRRSEPRRRILRPCTVRLPCPVHRRHTWLSHRLRMRAVCTVRRSMTRTSQMRMACVSTSMKARCIMKVGRPCRTVRTRTMHMPACSTSIHLRRHQCRTRTHHQATIDRVTRK